MSQTKYYKAIHKDGTHLAPSKDTEGAVRGSLLSNDNNKLSGQAEFVEVDAVPEYVYIEPTRDEELSEEAREMATIIGEALGELAFAALERYVFPYIETWAKNTVAPRMKKMWHWITRSKTTNQSKNNKSNIQVNVAEIAATNGMSTLLSKGFDTAYEKYMANTSSDDTQKELVEIAILSAILVAKIKKFLNSCEDKESFITTDYLEWQKIVEKITDRNVTESINSILENNVSLIDEKSSTFLSEILGYKVVLNGMYVPIENDRFAKALTFDIAA